MPASSEPKLNPFTVIVDTREQTPWLFKSLRGINPEIVAIQTTRATLKTGDYSIAGYEDKFTIERKSKVDLYKTLTEGRARFGREMDRLVEFDVALVIIEAGPEDIMRPPPRTKVPPRSIMGSIIAYMQRYPTVSWMMMRDRRSAEGMAFWQMGRYWKDQQG